MPTGWQILAFRVLFRQWLEQWQTTSTLYVLRSPYAMWQFCLPKLTYPKGDLSFKLWSWTTWNVFNSLWWHLHQMLCWICDQGQCRAHFADWLFKCTSTVLTSGHREGETLECQNTLDTRSSSKWGDCFESNQHSFQCGWHWYQGVVSKTPEDSSHGHWHLWRWWCQPDSGRRTSRWRWPKHEPTNGTSSQDTCTSCTSHGPWAYHWRNGFSSWWMCNWCFSWHLCARRSWWWSLKVYVILFVWCTAMTLLVAAAVWIGIKRIRAIEADAGHLALQGAQADTTLGEHMALLPEVQRSVGQVRHQVTATSSHMDMLAADSVDGIHYGLVEVGGFAQHREPTPVQRRHMFTVEQGRVAMNAKGHAQYMSAIRHKSQGFAWAGDGTDPSSPPPPVEPATAATTTGASSSNDPGVWSGVVYAEGGESESKRTEDHLLNPQRDMSTRQGELETSIDDLRLQLNVALAEELWSDADELQRTILMLLDHTNNQGMRNPETRIKVFQRIADSFRMIANRSRRTTWHEQCDHSQVHKFRRCLPFQDMTAHFGQIALLCLDARECEPLPVTLMSLNV